MAFGGHMGLDHPTHPIGPSRVTDTLGAWQVYEPQTSPWPQDGSTGRTHQHDLQQQHGPQTLTRPKAAAQTPVLTRATDINMAFSGNLPPQAAAVATNINMTSGDNLAWGWTVGTTDTSACPSCGMDHRYQHDFQE